MRVPVHPPVRTAPPVTRKHPDGAPVTELDVRDDLRNGREPFSRIMAAVETMPDDGVLHLLATFEPVPLLTLLGKRGFVHETLARATDDWSVWFWRTSPAAGAASRAPSTPAVLAEPGLPVDASAELRLDVRGLEPPEPMLRTLAALESLEPGRTLVQVNVRVPRFLLPILTERGFLFEIDESVEDRVLLTIRRSG